MKKALIVILMVFSILTSVVAGTQAVYTATVDLSSPEVIAKNFALTAAKTDNYSTEVKLAPGETNSYTFTVSNFDGGVISEVPLDLTITVRLSSPTGNAIKPLTMYVVDERGGEVGRGTVTDGVGAITVSDYITKTSQEVTRTYTVYVTWQSTENDVDYLTAQTKLGISVTGTQCTHTEKHVVSNSIGETLFAGGNGTEESPYLIADGSQLNAIQTVCANAYTVKNNVLNLKYVNYFQLTDNVTQLNRANNFKLELIGAVFDGNGYTVEGFNEKNGFFTRIEGSTVKNLNITGKTISNKVSNHSSSGILADIISARYDNSDVLVENVTIDNCRLLNMVASSTNVNSGVGFLAGRIYAHRGDVIVKDCEVTNSTMTVSANDGVYGTFVGYVRKDSTADYSVKVDFVNCTSSNVSFAPTSAEFESAVLREYTTIAPNTNFKTYKVQIDCTAPYVFINGVSIMNDLASFGVDMERYAG